MIAKASREETNGSEGIEVLVNERFDSELGPGIYTHKVIHLSQYVIGLKRMDAEICIWNSDPLCFFLFALGASLLGHGSC